MALTKATYAMIDGASLNVLDFGADPTGSNDSAAAIRLALDAVPLTGGAVFFPAGTYKVESVVYIPQRYSSNGYGITIYGDDAKIIGTGSNTIFETGTGTMSTGGASNWTQPPESATSVHYNSKILNLQFFNCGLALKLFNFIQNCAVRDCIFSNVYSAIYAKRCFYLDVTNCEAGANQSATSSNTLYKFESFNNSMTINGVAANGGAAKAVIGFEFLDGTYGNSFVNNAAESCSTGVKLNGYIQGNAFTGWYIEGNGIGINFDNANIGSTIIDACWFYGNSSYAIYMPSTTTGSWYGVIGKNNTFQTATDIVSIDSAASLGNAELIARAYTDVGTSSYDRTTLPTSWDLPESSLVQYQDIVYDGGTGYGQPFALMEPYALASGVLPFKFAGDVRDNHYDLIPFCKITNNTNPGPGTFVIDTKFNYDSTNGGYLFNFTIVDFVGTFVVSGIVYGGTLVHRFDALGSTVTASNNSGYLRLTIGNFTAGSITGKVRAV